MIYIYDEYFSNPEFIEHKSVYGNLKRRTGPYEFVDSVKQPTLFLISLDVYQDVPQEQVDRIGSLYKKHSGCKILIDTCIEDFLEESFFNLTMSLSKAGVKHDDVYVLSAQQFLGPFIDLYKVDYPVFGINRMEINFYDYVNSLSDNHKGLHLYRDIKPRKLKKHFISYKKNPRMLRLLFHGFFLEKGYIDKSYYSWHALNPIKPYHINACKEFGLFSNVSDLDNQSMEDAINLFTERHITSEDIGQSVHEWSMEEDVVLHGGINLTHETHQIYDRKFRENDKLIHRLDAIPLHASIFLTEKTYKNFAYGLPFLNPGVPRSEYVLKTLGYKTWDSFFKTRVDNLSYSHCIKSYMRMIDEIAAMPLQDLEDLLNSQQSLDYLNHNMEVFREQRQFKRLIDILIALEDK